MTAEKYHRISAPFRSRGMTLMLSAANKALTIATYLWYAGCVSYFFATSDKRLWAFIIVCGIPFVLLSIIRDHINAPRPYEIPGYDPVLVKSRKGRSFPSRHVFSMFVIGCASYAVNPAASVVIFISGIAMCFIRVIGGIHHPRDVIAGAAAGLISGTAGMLIYNMF